MMVEVILLEPVEKLGLPGDVVRVRPGYARNYLIPAGKALEVSPARVKEFEHRRRIAERRRARHLASLAELRDRVAGTEVRFVEKVADSGKLYGSVTERMIAAALTETIGHEISEHTVRLPEHIKEPGTYEVLLHLGPELEATVTVVVEGDRPVPAPEEVASAASAEATTGTGEAENAEAGAEEEPEA